MHANSAAAQFSEWLRRIPSKFLKGREVVVSWTDAASSARMLSAVVFDGRVFEYTRMKAPDMIMDDLIQRDDGTIGLLELLAVLLVIETLKETVMRAKWHAYIDNDGVLHSIIHASSKAVDVNHLVGLFWGRLHAMVTDVTAFRVESKAKIGDAGSRFEEDANLHDLKRLRAKFVSPRLLDFLYNIWSPLVISVDDP